MACRPNNLAASGWALLLAVIVAGCSLQPLRPQPQPHPPAHEPVLPGKVPTPQLEPLPPKAPAAPVAVVLSAEHPLYRAVAAALGDGDWTFYVLDQDNGDAVLQRLLDAGHERAIAIGRRALDLLATTELDVVYCQVFEPTAADLVTRNGATRRGVAPLPDFGAQLDAWRSRRPTLQRIGFITGSDYRDAGDRLAAAAEARGMTLQRAVVRNDKELLYVFRRMVPEIDGFVLYPDTSILSPEAIRVLLAYAARHGVQVLTYSPAVYRSGATTLLVAADPREVARKAVAALGAAAGPPEARLSHVVIRPTTGGAARASGPAGAARADRAGAAAASGS